MHREVDGLEAGGERGAAMPPDVPEQPRVGDRERGGERGRDQQERGVQEAERKGRQGEGGREDPGAAVRGLGLPGAAPGGGDGERDQRDGAPPLLGEDGTQPVPVVVPSPDPVGEDDPAAAREAPAVLDVLAVAERLVEPADRVEDVAADRGEREHDAGDVPEVAAPPVRGVQDPVPLDRPVVDQRFRLVDALHAADVRFVPQDAEGGGDRVRVQRDVGVEEEHDVAAGRRDARVRAADTPRFSGSRTTRQPSPAAMSAEPSRLASSTTTISSGVRVWARTASRQSRSVFAAL
ncbi:hypothetical protein BJF79_22600 [Actinomadura sp. CNU-125]|nr:hypothetical protein BJF79_22600 [Actinomadura sp. CNU-125]